MRQLIPSTKRGFQKGSSAKHQAPAPSPCTRWSSSPSVRPTSNMHTLRCLRVRTCNLVHHQICNSICLLLLTDDLGLPYGDPQPAGWTHVALWTPILQNCVTQHIAKSAKNKMLQNLLSAQTSAKKSYDEGAVQSTTGRNKNLEAIVQEHSRLCAYKYT